MQDFAGGGWVASVGQRLGNLLGTLFEILVALPGVAAAFSGTLRALWTSSEPARSPLSTFALAVVCALVLFAPGILLRRFRPTFVSRGLLGWKRLGIILADIIDLVVTLFLASIAVVVLFHGGDGIDQLAAALVWGVTRWRICMRGVDILLRPRLPQIRIVPASDSAARSTTRFAGLAFALGLAFVSFVPVLLEHGLPLQEARAAAVVLGTLDCVLGLLAVRSLSGGLQTNRTLAYFGGLGLVLSLWALWIGSVATLDFTVYDAYTATLTYGWIVALIHGVGSVVVGGGHDAKTTSGLLIASAIRRAIVVVAVVAGVAWIVHDWLVDVFQIVSPEQWPAVGWALHLAVAVSLLGYVGFEILTTWSVIRFGVPRASLVPGSEDNEPLSGSRLATTLPILSRILLVLSIGMGLLLGLANLGVNIGPLLAGAGIFGLAISFGSQALVKDIVSGFFFIVDDAFRVGEYIDTGRHKGSVERIALRSLRLRHQNGQVHTVPYGQIGAVTNFSRDWATMKFNLRLAPDTDLELVRKTAKAVGQSLSNDPEWRGEFLVPVKLQGIADITDNAIVLRFKFTARPVRVTTVQREAIRRLYDALLAKGVRFATTSVLVRSDGGTGPSAEAAGAAQIAATQSRGSAA
jgi:small-conductance mechanosensitive channel